MVCPWPVGIDLGTTFSVLARLDAAGRPLSVANAEGDLLTPSAVLFDRGEVVVGKEALKALATHAASVAQCAKREMGARSFHQPLGGELLPPEVIQAFVLRKLVADAGAALGEIRQAVITVPAYFDEVRRRSTRDAGFLAGLEVLDIINEPVAAAIAFGHSQAAGAPTTSKVLVYDLGGGTFDVTVMEIHGTEYRTLATDGDMMLGGQDWDQRLVELVAAEFMREFDLDPRREPSAHARLWRECEEAKRTLSARTRTLIAYDWQGHALRYELTRSTLEQLTRDLLDRTRFTVRQTLQAAGLAWKQVDRVLLVGGSSRMPAVKEMLQKLSGRVPETVVSADEAVAHGAALHAGALLDLAAGRPAPLKIQNVNSHSLGVVATEPATRRRQNAVVIPRNTPLPVSARRWFHTQKRNQRSLLVQILEGESSEPEACSPVARCVVRALPNQLPAKTPLEVRFGYEPNGLLQVSVWMAGDNQLLDAEIDHPNAMNRAELVRWRSQVLSGSLERPVDDDVPLADTET